MQKRARAHPSKISYASMPSDHMSTGKAAVMAIFLFPAAAIACTQHSTSAWTVFQLQLSCPGNRLNTRAEAWLQAASMRSCVCITQELPQSGAVTLSRDAFPPMSR